MEARWRAARAAVVGLMIGGALAQTACSAIERQETEETEKLLAAAGFKMKLADTPEKAAQLQAMKQQKILSREKDGTVYFLYADAKDCHFLYVVDQANYDAYQQLSVQRETAIANQEASLDNEEMNWGAWGYGYPGW